MNAPKISDSLTTTSCEILPMTPHSEVAPDPQKIDHFFGESVERQKNNKTMNTKMNATKQIKTKKTITCSVCGVMGHNKSNEKFHPIVVVIKYDDYCECDFPRFTINDDGIQSCRNCGNRDHYKDGVVDEWSDNESECDDEEKYEEGEKEFIDACLNDDFDTMKSLFEQKKNKSFNPDDLDLIAPKIADSHTDTSCEILPMTPHSEVAPDPQKIDHFFGESVEGQKNNKTMNTTEMNTMTELEQIESYYKVEFSKMSNPKLKEWIKTREPKISYISQLRTKDKLYHYIFQIMRQDDIGIHLNQINEDDLDLIIIKNPAPEPIPAVVVAPTPVKKTVPKPVFLNRKNRGECGVEGKLIMFPLLHMGCCEDPRGLVMTVTIPIPEKIDKKFLSGFADIVKKHPYFDWSGSSFMKNVIHPNKEHIQMVMGLDDFFIKRVMEDLHVVISHWDKKEIDEDEEDEYTGECEDYVPLNNETFFTDRNCEY